MFCSKCGANIADGSAFCAYCGNAVEADPVNNPTASNPASEQTYALYNTPAPEQAPAPEQTPVPEYAPQANQPYATADGVKLDVRPTDAPPAYTPPVNEAPAEVPPTYTPPVNEAPAYTPPVYTPPANEAYGTNTSEAPVKEKKRRKKAPIIIISLLLVVAIAAGAFVFLFFNRSNSPIQPLIDAYVNTQRDGYYLEITTTSSSNGREATDPITYYAYGVLDMETGEREFEMYKRDLSNGNYYWSYETPEYSFYDKKESYGSYGRVDSYGSLSKYEHPNIERRQIEFLEAISSGDYKDYVYYLNRDANYPILDEDDMAGFIRDLNSELSDEEYFNDIFGYTCEEDGDEITYTFEYDYYEVLEWILECLEEREDDFDAKAKYEYFVSELEDRLEYAKEENSVRKIEKTITIENGYIVYEKEVTTREYDDEDMENGRYSYTTTTEKKYSDHGSASADRDVIDAVNNRLAQLGSNQRMAWNDDNVSIYDKDGNRVN